MDRLRQICLEAYDRLIGLELSEVAVDCCITKAPCGGEKAGRSPVDRGKRGVKRSMAVDARGIPLGAVSAPRTATTRHFWSRPSKRAQRRLGRFPRRRASTSIADTTRSSPASGWRSWSWDGRSRGRVSPRLIGPRIDGWSSGRARGKTRTSFYEKSIPVKGRRGGSDPHPKSVTCAPLRVLLSALLWGQLPGDPVHDEVRPDSKALQSRVRSPSAKGPSSCSQSPKTGRFRALVIAPR